MADIKEKDLPKITSYSDIKELRLIKTDGSSVSMTVDNFINAVAEKIARVDGFASVVAELIGKGIKLVELAQDFNNLDPTIFSYGYFNRELGTLNAPDSSGNYFHIPNYAGVELIIAYRDSDIWTRVKWGENWGDWKSV